MVNVIKTFLLELYFVLPAESTAFPKKHFLVHSTIPIWTTNFGRQIAVSWSQTTLTSESGPSISLKISS